MTLTFASWNQIHEWLRWLDTMRRAGCASGPIFPLLVATTPARLGPHHAANAVGFQIAASAIGLSVLPGLVGVAADMLGVEVIARLTGALALLLVLVYRLLERAAPLGPTP